MTSTQAFTTHCPTVATVTMHTPDVKFANTDNNIINNNNIHWNQNPGAIPAGLNPSTVTLISVTMYVTFLVWNSHNARATLARFTRRALPDTVEVLLALKMAWTFSMCRMVHLAATAVAICVGINADNYALRMLHNFGTVAFTVQAMALVEMAWRAHAVNATRACSLSSTSATRENCSIESNLSLPNMDTEANADHENYASLARMIARVGRRVCNVASRWASSERCDCPTVWLLKKLHDGCPVFCKISVFLRLADQLQLASWMMVPLLTTLQSAWVFTLAATWAAKLVLLRVGWMIGVPPVANDSDECHTYAHAHSRRFSLYRPLELASPRTARSSSSCCAEDRDRDIPAFVTAWNGVHVDVRYVTMAARAALPIALMLAITLPTFASPNTAKTILCGASTDVSEWIRALALTAGECVVVSVVGAVP